METLDVEQVPPEDHQELLLCRVCGEWIDGSNLEEIYDHLEHTTGSSSD